MKACLKSILSLLVNESALAALSQNVSRVKEYISDFDDPVVKLNRRCCDLVVTSL